MLRYQSQFDGDIIGCIPSDKIVELSNFCIFLTAPKHGLRHSWLQVKLSRNYVQKAAPKIFNRLILTN